MRQREEYNRVWYEHGQHAVGLELTSIPESSSPVWQYTEDHARDIDSKVSAYTSYVNRYRTGAFESAEQGEQFREIRR